MARGKYSTRSEAARDREALSTDLGTYQRAVRDLTAEVRELKEKNAADKRVHDARVRQLQAEVREGTSAALIAARMEITKLRDDLGKIRGSSDEIHRKWENVLDGIHKHFMGVHGMKGAQAWEEVMGVLGYDNVGVLLQNEDEMMHRKGMPAEVVKQIQRAQGRRK
jgi:hypothetical protein